MTDRDILETWFRRVWQEEDLSAIDEMLAPDMQARGLREHPQIGPEEFRPFAEAMLALITDIKVNIRHHMQDGGWISALIEVNARTRNGGKPVSFTGQVLVRIRDGQLVEAYNHLDFISLYEQLGLMPEATLSQCLQNRAVSFA